MAKPTPLKIVAPNHDCDPPGLGYGEGTRWRCPECRAKWVLWSGGIYTSTRLRWRRASRSSRRWRRQWVADALKEETPDA